MKTRCVLAVALAMVLGSMLMFSGCAGSKATESKATMSGTWNLAVETPSGSGTPVFEIQEADGKLTGTYKGAFGESPLTGEVNGKDFVIKFTSSGLPMTYTGKLDGNKMKGSVDFGGMGKGTFEGQK